MDNSDIKTFEFELFKDHASISHAVFARAGGTSVEPFDSLNIGMNSGDQLPAVEMNRKRIIWKMGMKPLIFLNQVHGDDVKVLKASDNELNADFEPGKDMYTADAVITDMKGVYLVIQVADCQAILLYDPVKEVIANVHSGWRGSIKNIVGKCVAAMQEEFDCNPADILAGIAPSLGPCCAEFVNYKDEIPEIFWKYRVNESNYFDFWQMTCDQLLEKGVQAQHIENMQTCTKCNTQDFYSYRGENTTGRFACVISMEK